MFVANATYQKKMKEGDWHEEALASWTVRKRAASEGLVAGTKA